MRPFEEGCRDRRWESNLKPDGVTGLQHPRGASAPCRGASHLNAFVHSLTRLA